jgi:hypothetical protein
MTTDAEQRRFRHLRAALRQHLQDAAEVAHELPAAEHDLFLRNALDAWWDRKATEPMIDGDQFARMMDAIFSDVDDEPISATGSGEPETST